MNNGFFLSIYPINTSKFIKTYTLYKSLLSCFDFHLPYRQIQRRLLLNRLGYNTNLKTGYGWKFPNCEIFNLLCGLSAPVWYDLGQIA